MPLERHLREPLEVDWSFQVIGPEERLVAFRDCSSGNITSWQWDFGDGKTSSERHPTHQFQEPGEYIVTLHVEGPAGKARRTKVWDVTLP
jgi:PKD repeat protein